MCICALIVVQPHNPLQDRRKRLVVSYRSGLREMAADAGNTPGEVEEGNVEEKGRRSSRRKGGEGGGSGGGAC